MYRIFMGLILGLLWIHGAAGALRADLNYTASWVGNSFSGADDKWVQNFFINMVTQPDGTCNTWSHWTAMKITIINAGRTAPGI